MSNINQQRAIVLSRQISFFLFLFFSVVSLFFPFLSFFRAASAAITAAGANGTGHKKNIISFFWAAFFWAAFFLGGLFLGGLFLGRPFFGRPFFGRPFFCGRCRWRRRLLWRLTPPRQTDGNGRDCLTASGTAYADRQTRPEPDTTNNRTKQPWQ